MAPFRLQKKPAHPANDIAERLALYSSGTIFLRGTITFPSSALIGTVKAGRRIYDLVTKGKTNLSTTRIKELIARSRTRRAGGEQGMCQAGSTDAGHAYVIDERMKELGRLERYDKELSKITKAKNLPPEWATLEQRSRAAVEALGK